MDPSLTITPTAIPPGARRRAQQSTTLLHEWSEMQVWTRQPLYEERLGPTVQLTVGQHVTPALEAMLRRSNWYADLIAYPPGAIWVVESKMDPDPGAIGQALFYARLVMQTPALRERVTAPILPVVLFAVDDSDVRSFAAQQGVSMHVYTPPWYEDYLVTTRYRRRLPPSSSPSNAPGSIPSQSA